MTYPGCYHDAGRVNLDSCKFSNESVNVVPDNAVRVSRRRYFFCAQAPISTRRKKTVMPTVGMTVLGRYRLFSFNLLDQLLHGLGLVSGRSLLGNFLLFCC